MREKMGPNASHWAATTRTGRPLSWIGSPERICEGQAPAHMAEPDVLSSTRAKDDRLFFPHFRKKRITLRTALITSSTSPSVTEGEMGKLRIRSYASSATGH